MPTPTLTLQLSHELANGDDDVLSRVLVSLLSKLVAYCKCNCSNGVIGMYLQAALMLFTQILKSV